MGSIRAKKNRRAKLAEERRAKRGLRAGRELAEFYFVLCPTGEPVRYTCLVYMQFPGKIRKIRLLLI